MGFLDNSGDIILDAVLTDEGRKILAKGDGSFVPSHFRCGDDEINYGQYNKDHISGSAYVDLEILQTPILEAMTDGATALKSPLITAASNDMLYMPVLRLNTLTNTTATATTTGSFHVAVSFESREVFTNLDGCLDGYSPSDGSSHVRIDQGLDVDFDISPRIALSFEQRETTYRVLIDNRFGRVVDVGGRGPADVGIDDDNIAHYTFTEATDSTFVSNNAAVENLTNSEAVRGPRGTIFTCKIEAQIALRDNNVLFDRLGGTTTLADHNSPATVRDIRFIDSMMRVIGGDTGYAIDIPVRYIKLTSE